MRIIVVATLGSVAVGRPVAAQDAHPTPSAPTAEALPPTWTGTVSGGLALTSGNSDSSNFNVAYAIIRDPKTRNIFRSEGPHIRGECEGNLTVQCSALNVRDEDKLEGAQKTN